MSGETGYVYRATLRQNEMVALLTRLFMRRDAMVARRVDKAAFLTSDPADTPALTTDGATRLLEHWHEAQIFNAAAELRWRRQGENYAALLLSEQSLQLLLRESDGLAETFQLITTTPFDVAEPSKSGEHGFLLWGTHTDKNSGCWWESRIPQPLRYGDYTPKSDKAVPPHLAYKLYKVDETVRWIRLVKLVEAHNNG